jgi:DNA-binding transcriptional MerR regulator
MARGRTDHSTYSVGQLAAELGVSTRTLRFYEESGIVTPARTGSGAARAYTGRDRARLVLALRGKRFGMSLAEIREIVDMYDSEPGEAGQIHRLLDAVALLRADLESRQAEISTTRAEMDDVTRRCQTRLVVLAGPDAHPHAASPARSAGRTSAPTHAEGAGSGRVATGPTARGGPLGRTPAHSSPASGAKSR